MKSNFLDGPDMSLLLSPQRDIPALTIPNPLLACKQTTAAGSVVAAGVRAEVVTEVVSKLVNHDSYSKFSKLVGVYSRVLEFVNKLKAKVRKKSVNDEQNISPDFDSLDSYRHIVIADQREHFPEIVSYFMDRPKSIADIPDLVTRLNIFMDNCGILRVKSKFCSWQGQRWKGFSHTAFKAQSCDKTNHNGSSREV